MTRPSVLSTVVLAAALAAGGPALSATGDKKPPVPKARPADPATTGSIAAPSRPPILPMALAATAATPAADVGAIKQVLDRIRQGKPEAATDIATSIRDPLAKKLAIWAILRADDNNAEFAHYRAFVEANPGWPSVRMLRKRAENMLWEEKKDAATVRAFFGQAKPTTPKGRFALARALMAQGDRTAAAYYVREAWRTDSFSKELEAQALDTFKDLIGRADHKARMDRFLYGDDSEIATRAAARLGGHEPAIAKARIAVNAKSGNAGKLLDAVPAAARHDAGWIFSRVQWLRRQDKIADAGRLMLAAPRDPAQLHNLDEWWIERRLVARKLLDIGDARAAYQVARDAAPPTRDNYRSEHEFTAGWIALRFLANPAAAQAHFARIAHGTSNPIALARAGYWQGRAAEAAGKAQEARAHYAAASRYPTAYYGQLARARIGAGEIALQRPPQPSAAQRASVKNMEVVRALELLYAADARDFVTPMVADLADRNADPLALIALAEITQSHGDARATLLIGKLALGHGHPFDLPAFPTFGIPNYSAVGPQVERPIVYAIARQESQFNQRTVSSAKAYGLMQVTPPAGKYVAKKFGVGYDEKRLINDPVYNTQMGAAELGDLIQDYRGSYILSFAGYNAGRGRVREWVERYGDPRDPKVDPVDWVERIPFSETRNYVQRVMENLQVYRVRFGGGGKLLIEADLRRGAAGD